MTKTDTMFFPRITIFVCTCGAVPYNPENRPHGAVGLIYYRRCRHSNDTGWSVVCTRCGRVGERDRTPLGAAEKWNVKRLRYGPLKEENT